MKRSIAIALLVFLGSGAAYATSKIMYVYKCNFCSRTEMRDNRHETVYCDNGGKHQRTPMSVAGEIKVK